MVRAALARQIARQMCHSLVFAGRLRLRAILLSVRGGKMPVRGGLPLLTTTMARDGYIQPNPSPSDVILPKSAGTRRA